MSGINLLILVLRQRKSPAEARLAFTNKNVRRYQMRQPPPKYSSRRSLRSLYNLGLVVRRAGVFLRSPCRLAEGEDHAAAGSTDHSQELGGLG